MADKVPTIAESALSNNGERTVLTSVLAPGATTFPHFHTRFRESFTLLSGSLTVHMSPEGNMDPASFQAKELSVGETATVPIGFLHNFIVGDVECNCKVTFEPGTLDFERAMLIMRGTQRDGTYQQFGDGPNEENGLFMAVLSDLTNSNGVGDDKKMLDMLHEAKGKEIQDLRERLLEKYAGEEHLKLGSQE